MNIRDAKNQVKYTVRSYLTKNDAGQPVIPLERQRPIFLMGPPGIGKTAIMQQVADELGIALVAYSMTHHTRQSALGLPYIADKVYDGKPVRVSEYTMSEIISSMYEEMERTGQKEGILFLDEINCVSETLAPSMLQFLQFKTFGRHRIPDGWIVVTAGNPAEYNDSVRDFDIVTWDRLKRIDVEPDFSVWKEYAYKRRLHGAIITYLSSRPQDFYQVHTTVDGKTFVTARGWEDLSNILRLYEKHGFPVDHNLVEQYLQNEKVAGEFAVYYDLYQKYQSGYETDKILAGEVSQEIIDRAAAAPFDERLMVLGMLVDNLDADFRAIYDREEHLRILATELRGNKEKIQPVGKEEAMPTLEVIRAKLAAVAGGRTRQATQLDDAPLYYERALQQMDAWLNDIRAGDFADGAAVYEYLKNEVAKEAEALQRQAEAAGAKLSHVFEFAERAFGSGNEMLILVTELTSDYYSANFISHYGSPAYFEHNKDLMFYERQKEILREIDDLNL